MPTTFSSKPSGCKRLCFLCVFLAVNGGRVINSSLLAVASFENIFSKRFLGSVPWSIDDAPSLLLFFPLEYASLLPVNQYCVKNKWIILKNVYTCGFLFCHLEKRGDTPRSRCRCCYELTDATIVFEDFFFLIADLLSGSPNSRVSDETPSDQAFFIFEHLNAQCFRSCR